MHDNSPHVYNIERERGRERERERERKRENNIDIIDIIGKKNHFYGVT